MEKVVFFKSHIYNFFIQEVSFLKKNLNEVFNIIIHGSVSAIIVPIVFRRRPMFSWLPLS